MAEKEKKSSGLFEKLIPFLLVLSVGLAFAVGMLWQKVRSLESGGTRVAGESAGVGGAPTPPPQGKLSEEDAQRVVSSLELNVEKSGDDRIESVTVGEDDHVRGPRNAKVFLIEYTDLECPFCKTFHPTAQQVLEEYGNQVAWVMRHFPLDSIHPKARNEAEAAECAAELGGENGFWSFVDRVYEVTPSNNGLDPSKLPEIAQYVGINAAAFQECLDSGRHADAVEADYQRGIKAGITGTPGNILVNSKGSLWLIPGAVPFEALKMTIDEALQSL